MEAVHLQGARVLVREFETGDFEAVHRYGSDPEVSRYMDWGPNSEQETHGFLRAVIAAGSEDPRRQFELAVVVDGDLVGGVGLRVNSVLHQRGDMGYVLRRDAWGKGYASEAARLILRFGFLSLDLHRIEATCDPRNIGSRRVLERIGMRFEGQMREHMRTHGAWRDSLLYAILRGEWAEMQEGQA